MRHRVTAACNAACPLVLAGAGGSGVQPAAVGVAARAEQQGPQHRQPGGVAARGPAPHAPGRRLHCDNWHRPAPAQHQPPAGAAAAMLMAAGHWGASHTGEGKLSAGLLCLGAAPVIALQRGLCLTPAAVLPCRTGCRRSQSRSRDAHNSSSTRAVEARPPAWRRPRGRLLAPSAGAAPTRRRSHGRPPCSMRSSSSSSSSSQRCLTSSSGAAPECPVDTAAASAQLERCGPLICSRKAPGPEFVIARRCGSPAICDGTPFSSFSSAARIKESRFSSAARSKESMFSH